MQGTKKDEENFFLTEEDQNKLGDANNFEEVDMNEQN